MEPTRGPIPTPLSSPMNPTKEVGSDQSGRSYKIITEQELLFQGSKISKGLELNFASIKINEEQKLVAVVRNHPGQQYAIHEGSSLEALLKQTQDSSQWEKDDESGISRIYTLDSDTGSDLLDIIKDENISTDLSRKISPNIIFNYWADKENWGKVELILQLIPSIEISSEDRVKVQNKMKAEFISAASAGSFWEASANRMIGLIDALGGESNIDWSEEELWIKRAFKNDCIFSDEDFNKLDQDLKLKIYFIANAYGNETLVEKLKPLGMDKPPLSQPMGPSTFTRDMDIITAKNTIQNFCKDLRGEGLLLTAEEFKEINKEKKYRYKGSSVDRIQGKNFIDKFLKENGFRFQHIKVPKKLLVLKEDTKVIDFNLNSDTLRLDGNNEFEIYAENIIKRVQQKLSLDEAIELMIFLEETRFQDCSPRNNNILYAEDGIYFIDTEFKSFFPKVPRFDLAPRFDVIEALKHQLSNPQDVEKFSHIFKQRKDDYDRKREGLKNQEMEYREFFKKNPEKNLMEGYTTLRFILSVDSLKINNILYA